MRKAVGAHRFQLIRQFLSESLLLAFLAFFIAIGMVILLLPSFNSFVGKVSLRGLVVGTAQLTLDMSTNGFTVLSLAGVALVVGLLAGSYPAFFLSAFHPVQVLKGNLKRGRIQDDIDGQIGRAEPHSAARHA